ncbi:MAG: M1 family metallopeptidase [Chloroflexi bacterium]|nr:M1 family metallopeptidase [Chloroflexota bacterium]
MASETPLVSAEDASVTAAAATPAATSLADEGVADTATVLPAELMPYSTALRAPFVQDLAQFGDATRYDIQLSIASDLQHVTGTQQVRYVNRSSEALDEILLRLYPNTDYLGGDMVVTDLRVDGAAVKPVPFLRSGVPYSGSTMITDTSVLSVPMPSPLRPGQAVVLDASFLVTVPLQARGGYRTFGWSNGVIALPNTYVMIPVRGTQGWLVDAAPTYGDVVFSETSLYHVRIRAPADLVIAATGVCGETPTSTAALPSGATRAPDKATLWKETVCVAGPVRDVAIHASNQYQVLTTTVHAGGNILVGSYYLPSYQRGGQRALIYAAEALSVYTRRLGAYPFKVLNVFASPTVAGGIEYPMLAGVTDSLYEMDGGYFEWIVAHEVAHQWWYSMVGSDPINEPWLDESLTQYMASLYIEDRYGAEAAAAERERYFTARYQRELRIGRDAPVAQPTGAFDRAVYSPLVYGKGPLFFDAVRRTVGDRLFDSWLRIYFARNRYKIVHAENLLSVADEIGIGRPVRQAFDEWMRSARRP